jgi:hypothetical protein
VGGLVLSEQRTQADLFELVLYLVSCARLALDEPPIYGSFRLLEGASRLVATAEEVWDLEVDELLLRARETIEREKMRMIEDHEGYRQAVDLVVRDLSADAVRRTVEGPSPP